MGKGYRQERMSLEIESTINDSLSGHENYFQSILGSVSYCVFMLRTPPYWSVTVALSCNFKLGG